MLNCWRHLCLTRLSTKKLSPLSSLHLTSLCLEYLPVFKLPAIPSLEKLTLCELPWNINLRALRSMPLLVNLTINSKFRDAESLATISTQLTDLNIDHTDDHYKYMLNSNIRKLNTNMSEIPAMPHLRELKANDYDNTVLDHIHEYPNLLKVGTLLITEENVEKFYNLIAVSEMKSIKVSVEVESSKFYNAVIDKTLLLLKTNTKLEKLVFEGYLVEYKNKKRVKSLFKYNTTLIKLHINASFVFKHPTCDVY